MGDIIPLEVIDYQEGTEVPMISKVHKQATVECSFNWKRDALTNEVLNPFARHYDLCREDVTEDSIVRQPLLGRM